MSPAKIVDRDVRISHVVHALTYRFGNYLRDPNMRKRALAFIRSLTKTPRGSAEVLLDAAMRLNDKAIERHQKITHDEQVLVSCASTRGPDTIMMVRDLARAAEKDISFSTRQAIREEMIEWDSEVHNEEEE